MKKQIIVLIEKYLLIAIVFFMLLLCKTVFFGIVHRKVTYIIFIILLMVITIIKIKKLSFAGVIRPLLFLSALIILSLFFSITKSNYAFLKVAAGALFVLFLSALIVVNIKKRDYINWYINIMVFFSVVSLICLAIAVFYPSLADKLYQLVITDENKTISQTFLISPFYTWGKVFLYGKAYFSNRNFGPFWEPGAFQGFLVLAILMLLFVNEQINKKRTKIFILLITIITTRSTTGYIIIIIFFLFFQNDFIRLFFPEEDNRKQKNKKLKIIFLKVFLVIFGILGIALIVNSSVFTEKFFHQGESYESFAIRTNDFFLSIQMILEHPFFGYGFGIEERTLQLNLINNSNGLFSAAATYGLVFMVTYLVYFKKGLRYFFKLTKKSKNFLVYIIFLILFCTEDITFFLVYLVFLFKWQDNENG